MCGLLYCKKKKKYEKIKNKAKNELKKNIFNSELQSSKNILRNNTENNVEINDEINENIENKNIETLKIILNSKLPPPKKWDENKIWSFGYHKAFLGYLNAYFDHCPIKISPNVIWQLILNAFSEYVNDYSEYLRDKFVNFNGKKELTFVRVGTFKDLYKYEEGIIEEFCEKISENVGEEIVDILTPNFSTSTKDTIIAGKVSIMSTFKKYFEYYGLMRLCGIPYIILEGTLEDWEKILKKFKSLSKYEFINNNIEKDIKEIINTKKGKINYKFWRTIIMETKEIVHETIDCLDEEVEKNVIRGWICDFYPGLKRNLEKSSYDLVDEVLKVPVHIKEIGKSV